MSIFLLFLMLTIRPATQSFRLFAARNSLFNADGNFTLGSRDGWRIHLRELRVGGQTGTTFTIELPITKN